jgi:hypothetical protein
MDELEKRRTSLEIQIAEFSASRRLDVAQFKTDLRRWFEKASLKSSANVAVIVTICSAIGFLAARLADVSVLAFMDDVLIWLRSPLNLILPFKAGVVGYFAAVITYPVARYIHNKRVTVAAESYVQSLPTNDLPDDYQPTLVEFDDPEEDVESDEYFEAEEEPDVEAWYEVLKVNPEATIAEIKSAHRLQLKQNHPDNVATLGVRIREAAEAESKRINAAYEEARVQRRF